VTKTSEGIASRETIRILDS